MPKRRLKRIIWAVLLVIVLASVWGAIRGISDLLASFQRGVDPASALNIVPNVPTDLHVELTWQPDDPDTGRTVDPFSRTQIESAYLRAWLQWNLSYIKGAPYGLKTYFASPALQTIGAAVSDAADHGLRIEQADTTHQLQLHLYSADGSIASFTDHNVVVAQIIRDASGAVVFAGKTRADYDVVMILTDGNWQVRQWVRRDAGVDAAQTRPTTCPSCVSVVQGSLTLDQQPFVIAGMNYYPQSTPWDTFWPHYNPAIIDRDFTRIKGLGLNTVRIFVPYAQFGGPHVEPAMIAQLRDLLDQAQAQELKVVVTLFDFRSDYDLLHWADADRQLQTLLTAFVDHPAILAWDLKNEADLDYARVGRETVDAWLIHIARQARRFDPNHLLTIGWSNPQAAQHLADQVDMIQFHYYGLAANLSTEYAALRAVAPSKPIVLGEFGMSTWNSVFPNGHTEAEQRRYYADLLAALRQTNSVGCIAWTLYDFDTVPATVVGRWPWQTGPQQHLGVLRADGSPKPAAALLMPGAPLDVPSVQWWARFLKPFWLLIGGFLLGGSLAIWIGRQRTITARPRHPISTPRALQLMQETGVSRRRKRRPRRGRQGRQ